MTVATLGMRISSEDAARASRDLDRLTGASKRVQAASLGTSAANDNMARASARVSAATKKVIADLEFERGQLKRTAAERIVHNNLRRAGVTAASAEGAAIAKVTAALHAEEVALARRNRLAAAAGRGLGLAGVLAVGLAARSFIGNTVEQQKVMAQLEAVIRSTGGGAGLAAGELAKMGSEMQRVTTFGDEAVISAQGLLLTFTRIGRDVFPNALDAVLNVSTAMGTELKESALQVGKALNDPVLGMTALSRSGI